MDRLLVEIRAQLLGKSMHRALEIFVYNIMRKRRTLYDLSETIVVFFFLIFFLALINPGYRVKLEDISKKKS